MGLGACYQPSAGEVSISPLRHVAGLNVQLPPRLPLVAWETAPSSGAVVEPGPAGLSRPRKLCNSVMLIGGDRLTYLEIHERLLNSGCLAHAFLLTAKKGCTAVLFILKEGKDQQKVLDLAKLCPRTVPSGLHYCWGFRPNSLQ